MHMKRYAHLFMRIALAVHLGCAHTSPENVQRSVLYSQSDAHEEVRAPLHAHRSGCSHTALHTSPEKHSAVCCTARAMHMKSARTSVMRIALAVHHTALCFSPEKHSARLQ